MQPRNHRSWAGGALPLPQLRQRRDLALLNLQEDEQPLPLPELRVRRALGVEMGDVLVTLRLMPSSAEVDLAGIELEVRKRACVYSIEREPVAFGLEALRVLAVIPDAAGGTDPLEQALAGIEGVGSVQVIDIRRLL